MCSILTSLFNFEYLLKGKASLCVTLIYLISVRMQFYVLASPNRMEAKQI